MKVGSLNAHQRLGLLTAEGSADQPAGELDVQKIAAAQRQLRDIL